MPYAKGTSITVTTIQRKDFTWFDGDFEELSSECNGQPGTILLHHPPSPEFGERESYLALVRCTNGTAREVELEPDEFAVSPSRHNAN